MLLGIAILINQYLVVPAHNIDYEFGSVLNWIFTISAYVFIFCGYMFKD